MPRRRHRLPPCLLLVLGMTGTACADDSHVRLKDEVARCTPLIQHAPRQALEPGRVNALQEASRDRLLGGIALAIAAVLLPIVAGLYLRVRGLTAACRRAGDPRQGMSPGGTHGAQDEEEDAHAPGDAVRRAT